MDTYWIVDFIFLVLCAIVVLSILDLTLGSSKVYSL